MSSPTSHEPQTARLECSTIHETIGVLNRTSTTTFSVGISEDKGNRRTMEDAHRFLVDFGGIQGQGFFAIFDGHAGKQAAEWCADHFHETLLKIIDKRPGALVPDILNSTFLSVDHKLLESKESGNSGCTAVTAFLRIEDDQGFQSFMSDVPTRNPAGSVKHGNADNSPISELVDGTGSDGIRSQEAIENLSNPSPSSKVSSTSQSSTQVAITIPPARCRRVLYCANAGDARGVLCRNGKAVRLTYDHKGSDRQEAKRITDAGGFVLAGRVNGLLAVTRSLGDAQMKQLVIGAPYTTETELCDADEFLILACDGLWDVIPDQKSVELIRNIQDPQEASQRLLKHAIKEHTTDNVTVTVIRFKQKPQIRNSS